MRLEDDTSDGGVFEEVYQLHELDFELNYQLGRPRKIDTSVPLLPLPWTVVHRIDKSSPLFGLTEEMLEESHVEIIAVMDGVDEATSSNLQARWSYTPDDIVWGAKFTSMVHVRKKKKFFERKISNSGMQHVGGGDVDSQEGDEGIFVIDYAKLSEIEQCDGVITNDDDDDDDDDASTTSSSEFERDNI